MIPTFKEFTNPTEETIRKYDPDWDSKEPDMTCPICKESVLDMDADQYFMVKDELWYDTVTKAGYSPYVVMCRDCFEGLLGRPLTEDDLTPYPVNEPLRKKLKRKHK